MTDRESAALVTAVTVRPSGHVKDIHSLAGSLSCTQFLLLESIASDFYPTKSRANCDQEVRSI
jgi:hypothetical protein